MFISLSLILNISFCLCGWFIVAHRILNKLTPEFFEQLATQLASPDMGLASSEALLTSFVYAVVEKGTRI